MHRPATVAIIYGDPVVGNALSLLLRGIDRRVRLEDQGLLDCPERVRELIREVGVLILAPGISAGRRETILEILSGDPDAADIRVTELGRPPEALRARADHYLPWPMRAADLRQYIEAVCAEADREGDSGGRVLRRHEEER